MQLVSNESYRRIIADMERFINELNNTIDHERAFVELCKRVLLLDEFKSLLSLKLEIYSLLQKRNDDGL